MNKGSAIISEIIEEEKNMNNNFQNKLFMILGEDYRIRRLKEISYSLKIFDIIIFICGWLGAFISVIACEKYVRFSLYDPQTKITLYDDTFAFPNSAGSGNETWNGLKIEYTYSDTVNYLRICVTTLTTILVICLSIRYAIGFKYLKLKLMVKEEDFFLCHSQFFWFLIEFILNVIHSPPAHIFDTKISIPQTNSDTKAEVELCFIITCYMLFARSYLLIKVIIVHSKWSDPSYEKICHEYHTIQDHAFYFKAVFRNHPFFIISVCFFFTIFIFGYSVRAIELVFMNVWYNNDGATHYDWRYFWNGMWCVIITMATVGFGDYVPISMLGRAFTLISCSCGTLMISLLIAALENVTEFESNESIAFDSMKKKKDEVTYVSTAVKFLQTVIRYRKHIKSGIDDEKSATTVSFLRKKSNLYNKIKEELEMFRQIKKAKQENIEHYQIENSINKLEENLMYDMEKIKKKEALGVIDDVKSLMEEFKNNQKIIKWKMIELYKELEELRVFKDQYIKNT